MSPPSYLGHAGSNFTSTRWSVILAARDNSEPGHEEAMAALCATYWRPIYSYIRKQGKPVEDAQDLTQSFFSQLLERDSLRHVDPALGRFRSFLLACVRNFLAGQWRHTHAARRGGGSTVVSLEDMTRAEDSLVAGGMESRTPEEIYERNWALALLEQTRVRLAEEFAASGKSDVFELLMPYLTGEHDQRPYSDVAAKLGVTEVTARVSVHRMRGRFQDLLRAEVARTLPEPENEGAVMDELRYLLSVL